MQVLEIFINKPYANLSYPLGLLDSAIGTMILIIAILAFTDKKNEKHSLAIIAFIAALVLTAIPNAFGMNGWTFEVEFLEG